MGQPTITIGADPEFFLGRSNKEFKSSIDLIGGSKAFPRPLGGRPGFAVQEDNVAVEFNIPPATTVEEFVESIQWSLKTISDEIKPMGLKPVYQASALFPPTELMDARAESFGCDPDYNAWQSRSLRRLTRNPKPSSPEKRLRSCGGHVHVGYPQDSLDGLKLIKLMDLTIGVPSVVMDEDEQRRVLYGRAGAFRPTDYGVEYRVPSNFWLKSAKYMKWIYEQTQRAVQMALELKDEKAFDKFITAKDLCDDIQTVINETDFKLAQLLIKRHSLKLVHA